MQNLIGVMYKHYNQILLIRKMEDVCVQWKLDNSHLSTGTKNEVIQQWVENKVDLMVEAKFWQELSKKYGGNHEHQV